jgi:hypothetical protein
VVDDEDIDGSVGGLELKAELTLEGSAEGRGRVAEIWNTITRASSGA